MRKCISRSTCKTQYGCSIIDSLMCIQARLRQADRDRREAASIVTEHCISVHSSGNSLFDSVLRVFYRPGIM